MSNAFDIPGRRFDVILIAFALLALLPSCDEPNVIGHLHAQSGTSVPPIEPGTGEPSRSSNLEDELISRRAFERRYPWPYEADPWPRAAELRDVFEPPEGFERIELEGESFGAFLRRLPLRLDRTTVYRYDGEPLSAPAAAIAMIPVGERDLQQCADFLLRIHAEYLWSAGRRGEIAYHFTSGDRSAWRDWAEGERFRVAGSEVERHRGASPDANRSNFGDYLEHLFMYAGTRSMSRDARRVPVDEPIRPGDFFLDPGSPGHVVMILDIAESDAGPRLALVGQGYIPAREFHVLERGDREEVWFELPDEAGERLDTPSWPAFDRRDAWRFTP